jgi:hypothetical protein
VCIRGECFAVACARAGSLYQKSLPTVLSEIAPLTEKRRASDVAATIGAMRPTPGELEVARALIARVKAADPSIKRVDELLVCAAVACRADELVAAPDFALGRWARTSRGREAGDRLGRSAWEARANAFAERSPAAACSCSQLGSTRMCWPDFRATSSLVRKIPACLCQVHRLLAADRGWGGASAHLEVEGRRIPGSSRWVLTCIRGIASACP